jgi:recombinational DNA repair protein (RecF pathway)
MTECDECGRGDRPGYFHVDGRALCRACRNEAQGDTRLPSRGTPDPHTEAYNRARVINNDRGQQ